MAGIAKGEKIVLPDEPTKGADLLGQRSADERWDKHKASWVAVSYAEPVQSVSFAKGIASSFKKGAHLVLEKRVSLCKGLAAKSGILHSFWAPVHRLRWK